MFETVSVDEALARGRRRVFLPAILIPVVVGIAALTITVVFDLLPLLLPVFILGGIVAAFWYRGYAVVKWRLWAFNNVRNVNELKARAIKENLLSADNGFFSKLEVWTQPNRREWEALQEKFKTPDVFTDDYTVLVETLIYFSKKKAVFYMIINVVFFGGGLSMVISRQSIIAGCILLVVTVFWFYSSIKEYNNRQPQIILNNNGIQTASNKYYGWGDINEEDVIKVSAGKSTNYYLTYNNPYGQVKLNIRDFDITHQQLEKLLRIYRGRYMKMPRSN